MVYFNWQLEMFYCILCIFAPAPPPSLPNGDVMLHDVGVPLHHQRLQRRHTHGCVQQRKTDAVYAL